MLESNNIPVLSIFGGFAGTITQTDDNNKAEDPIKESETIKMASAKDYLHQVYDFNFDEPVVIMAMQYPALFKTKFPYTFYPDVPTPPPNC